MFAAENSSASTQRLVVLPGLLHPENGRDLGSFRTSSDRLLDRGLGVIFREELPPDVSPLAAGRKAAALALRSVRLFAVINRFCFSVSSPSFNPGAAPCCSCWGTAATGQTSSSLEAGGVAADLPHAEAPKTSAAPAPCSLPHGYGRGVGRRRNGRSSPPGPEPAAQRQARRRCAGAQLL